VSRRKEMVSVYLEPHQVADLKRLTSITKVPMSEYVR
jgi:hypothetical protein